jgi:hypothetical protein
MPSQYLTVEEAPEYGLKTVDTGQIVQASALIDAYLKRPEGLVWAPDSQGAPAYMVAASPRLSFALTAPVAPGSNVPVQLSGPVGQLVVGDVLVLDRPEDPSDPPNPNPVEACVVSTTTGSGQSTQITLQTVLNAHASGASADLGLLIEQQKYMPANRPITRVSRTPLVRLISGTGRYAYGRRGDGANYNMEQFNLLAALSKFGGPPVWELWQQPLNYSWDAETGQVWAPAGIMLAYYSEVKLRYVAGFPAAGIPSAVKLACAQLIEASKAFGPMGDMKAFRAGDTQLARFTSSVLDADTKRMLTPYMTRAFV